MTRDPFSREAEQGVLGAMLIKPELIDILSADLRESDFNFSDNREVFRTIMAMRAENLPVDFLLVGERLGTTVSGDSGLAYAADLYRNTPSAANAKEYARVVSERAIDRALVAAAQTIHESAYSDDDTADKLAACQSAILAVDATSATPEVVPAGDVLRNHIRELERREELGGAIDGLAFGLADLDKRLMGMTGGQLIVVAGRAKMGKTTLAMGAALHNAIECGKQVLVCSLEMPNHQLMDRMIASVGGIPLSLIKSGVALRSHPSELNIASGKIIASGLSMADRSNLEIDRIRSMARRHKMIHGLDLLLVDHIGLIGTADSRANPVARVSEVTRKLKLLAIELDIPIIALSQLNRALEMRPNKRPIPSDLRDSGSIEQDADVVIFAYRDEVYNEHSESKGIAEINIGIARDIETGMVRAKFEGKYSRFSNLDQNYREPLPAPTRSYSDRSLLD